MSEPTLTTEHISRIRDYLVTSYAAGTYDSKQEALSSLDALVKERDAWAQNYGSAMQRIQELEAAHMEPKEMPDK